MRLLTLAALAMMAFALSAAAQGTAQVKVFKLENRDAQELLSMAEQMVTPGGSASVDERTNSIVATGTPAQLDQLGTLLAELDQALKQVTLTVYVAEISTALEERFGLNFSGTTVLERAHFDTALKLIDTQQEGRIEQFMTVTTMSGDPAYLQVSTDQFVTLGQQQNPWGGTDTLVVRVPVGEFLEVKPRVKPDGTIEVELTPVVSRSGQQDDIIVRTATTRLSVPDGGTVAIGGASTVTDTGSQQGVPLIPLEASRQAGGQRLMMFLTATTENGTNMFPAMPDHESYENPEVIGPKRQVRNRDNRGPLAH
jgi:type II secretory pathway component GspD/PulD (secretin)